MSESNDVADAFEDFEGDLPETVDRAAVRRMQVVAKLLDDSIPVPGTNYRIGLDPIASIAPVAGDVATGIVSLYIVAESARLGVSYGTLIKMLLNISLDVGGGSIPVVGPIFDAVWKSNVRNVELLMEELQAQADREAEPHQVEVQ